MIDRSTALLEAALSTTGFFPEEEARALYRVAQRAALAGQLPIVEIGAYRGRSSLVLAAAVAGVADANAVVLSVDHHHGSEEMQAGWPDHDPSLIDPKTGIMDSLPAWRDSIAQAHAEDLVIGLIGDSRTIASNWSGPIGLLLLDGGHGEVLAWSDYRGWSRHLRRGGHLVFHDVFDDPADGGRPPHDCYRDAIDSGVFVEDREAALGSLRVLVKVRD